MESINALSIEAFTHMSSVFLFSSSSYGIAAIAPFSHRLAFDNLPFDIQHLRCKVNFEALVFVPHIKMLAESIISQLRSSSSDNRGSDGSHLQERTESKQTAGKYVVLHLRFDKVCVFFPLLLFQFSPTRYIILLRLLCLPNFTS